MQAANFVSVCFDCVGRSDVNLCTFEDGSAIGTAGPGRGDRGGDGRRNVNWGRSPPRRPRLSRHATPSAQVEALAKRALCFCRREASVRCQPLANSKTQGVATYIRLISGWYPAAGFGQNMSVFSIFSRFLLSYTLLFLLSTDIWLILVYPADIF